MWRKYVKPVVVVVVLVATIAVFVNYFVSHPAVRHQLSHISLGLILLLIGLYCVTILALGFVNAATLRLCHIKANLRESWLITAYTAVVNFFGPLQSGPAARGVYLKQKYNLNLKKYALASLVYYFFWATFSGLFLLSGLLKWWLVPLTVLGLCLLWLISRRPKIKNKLNQLDLRDWYLLGIATFVQIVFVTLIYYTELRNVQPSVRFDQAIIYTGAANFALFVSITPGAIGFRESFLVFSRHLHHISNSTIIAANIIDRSVYIIVLLFLGLLILLTHARKLLGLKS